ncbi:MAG: hypothetical protein RBU45_13870 [Myxococcota bacterium]|jgi:hypothetical protein|nr:hypothetical protein [Myxococcota bacterium]
MGQVPRDPRCRGRRKAGVEAGWLLLLLLPGGGCSAATGQPADLLADEPRGPAAAVATPPVAGAGTPTQSPPPLLTVPPALAHRSRLEPSGLLWVPELERFLVASDDTGTEERDDHAPWLFTLAPSGEFDPAPTVLAGVEKINDIEGLTSGAGRIWVVCSQSVNRHGRRPRSRQLLLEVALGPARELTVVGRTQLLQAVLDAAEGPGGLEWLQGLGLGERSREALAREASPRPASARGKRSRPRAALRDLLLDLEGIAWWEGSLLLGLKEPLTSDRRALIWRLADPAALLRGGRLVRQQLTVLARLDLTLPDARGLVPQGVSDLFPAGEGELGILSTSPDATHQEWGGVWLLPLASPLPERAGDHRPRLLASFRGWKPEGGARGPDGRLTVVFDDGAGPPRWLRLAP